MEDYSIAMLDAVRAALEKAASVQEVKDIIDRAKAAEVYAQQARLGKDIQLKASEYIVRSERKLGEMLAAAKAAGQIGKGIHFQKRNVDDDDITKVNLSEAGISRDLSSRAQKLANIPEKEFEQNLAVQKEAGTLSSKQMLRSNGQRPVAPKSPKGIDGAASVISLWDEGVTLKQIAKQTGVDDRQIDYIIREEKIRREERAEKPTVTAEMLDLSQQKKLEVAIEQHKKKLEAEYYVKVEIAAQRYLSIEGEKRRELQEQAKKIMDARRGFMSKAVYENIRNCLHPDRGLHPDRDNSTKLKASYEKAFHDFRQLEKFLLSEKDSPTQWPSVPSTVAEWKEAKRKHDAQRKASRQQARNDNSGLAHR